MIGNIYIIIIFIIQSTSHSAFGSGSDRTGFSSTYTSDRIASSIWNIASYTVIQMFKDIGSNLVRYIHINL